MIIMAKLCKEVLQLIIEYVLGISPNTRKILNTYFPSDLFMTVPNEIRKTWLRRYLQEYTVPSDYLIYPYGVDKKAVEYTRRMKFVHHILYQKELTYTREIIPNIVDEIIFPKIRNIILQLPSSNPNTKVKIGDLELVARNPENTDYNYSIQIQFKEDKLTLSNNALYYLCNLPKNITHLSLDHFIHKVPDFANLRGNIFDNITILSTTKGNSKLWFYPKNLEKHIIMSNDCANVILHVNKTEFHQKEPVIFYAILHCCHISARYVKFLEITGIITKLICRELSDYDMMSEPVHHIDISHLDNILTVYTHENKTVKYNKNIKYHIIYNMSSDISLGICKTIKLK